MPSAIYKSLNGRSVSYDLDRVTDIAQSFSSKRAGWTSTLIYVTATDSFVELRSSPQDVRGNSLEEEQEEVDATYIALAYALDLDDLRTIRAAPSMWAFVDRRS